MIKINNKVINFNNFPNGEWGIENFELPKNTWFIKIDWNVNKGWEKELITLLAIGKEIKTQNDKSLNEFKFTSEVFIDYFPLLRDDKTKGGRVAMGKHIFELLKDNFNYLQFNTLHNVELNKFGNNDKLEQLIDINSNNKTLFVYPDKSAFNRLFRKPPSNYIVFEKTRDFKSGKINGLEPFEMTINDQEIFSKYTTETDGKIKFNKIDWSCIENIVMVDDICSFGNSFIYAYEELSNIGIIALINNNDKVKLITLYDEGQDKKDKFNKFFNHIWIKNINFKQET